MKASSRPFRRPGALRGRLGALALGLIAASTIAHDAEAAVAATPDRVAASARRYGITWKTSRRTVDGTTLTTGIALRTSAEAVARARINAWLSKQVRPPQSCADGSCDEGNDMDVQFANDRFFAVAGNYFWSGGAHPSNGFVAVTFDPGTGARVSWPALLRIDESSAADRRLDLHRNDLLAALVLRQLQQPPHTDDDCFGQVLRLYGCKTDLCDMPADASTPPSAWAMFPTENGLAVAPDIYSEAERGCRGSTVTVPWPEVAKTQKQPGRLP